MSFFLEVPEIEKQKDISVFTQVKEDHILLPESEPKVENSKEPGEEDDYNLCFNLTILAAEQFVILIIKHIEWK